MVEGLTHGWGFGWLIMLGLIVLVIVIWYMVKMMKKNAPTGLNKTPRQILDERFASGEISEEEYDHKKKRLED